MKQIAFISGKGGTGKSTLVASLVQLVENKRFADCDVDAPNLHLLVAQEHQNPENYYGSKKALIDQSKCVHCDMCRQTCRFDAISEDHVVDPLSCEGCAACTVMCPTDAISLVDTITGVTDLQSTDYGIFASASLETGADGSGKLVTQVRKRLFDRDAEEEWTLIDGSPGIGCVVIASITGTDAVVAVCEPTKSGRHDLKRVLDVANHFKIPAYVCINKYDLDEMITMSIEQLCRAQDVPVLAKIPFDPEIMQALQSNMTPIQAGVLTYQQPVEQLWNKLKKEIEQK
ncbi:MAG: ATP-binding protein [Eubacteriales bacterium]|nr:ATP-binding protein [Eubacteriales bacterium]MDD3197541.1 ATP-binding protein [Eubacteriales bacterium]